MARPGSRVRLPKRSLSPAWESNIDAPTRTPTTPAAWLKTTSDTAAIAVIAIASQSRILGLVLIPPPCGLRWDR
jgi:hypothetical protein